MIEGLGHVAIRAKNLDESLRFYTGVLGLREAFRMGGEGGAPAMVYLYIAPGQFLELFGGGTRPAAPTPETIGLCHICLQVGDIQAARRLLQARGAPLDSEIITGKSKCLQFWTHDPDGNSIELMQLPPESLQAQANERFTEQAAP